jgi:predicted N-acyltransferase
MIEIKIFAKIEEIPQDDWARVFPKVAENYRFFKTLDRLDFGQFRFYYLIAYDKGVPVGATSLFLMDFQLDMAAQGLLKSCTKFIKKIFPRLLSAKILFCGLISGRGRIGISSVDPAQVLDAFVAAMEGLAKKELARAIVFKDFDPSYDTLMHRLREKGFLRQKNPPLAIMNITFADFEGYLKTLSSVSRQGLRRKLKKIEQNPRFDLEITSFISEEVSCQMHGLYLETTERAEIEFEELPRDYFSVISREMPESNKFFLWRLNGKLVAFAQCLVEGNYFIDYYLGFDYTVAYEYNFYYVRFKALLEWCMSNGMKTYEMGQSSYEIKRRLGFELMPLYAYSRPCGKFSIPLFKFYHRFLTFERLQPLP